MLMSGRVALITGAGSGIGRATALRFAAAGAAVVAADMDPVAAEATVAELTAAGGVGRAAACDVRDEAAATATVRLAESHYGGLDVLVNNAGVLRLGSAVALAPAEWQTVVDTNLTGTYLMARVALPLMRQRGGGAVVNVSSISGLIANRNYAAYNAAKAGVIGLTRSLALDFAPWHVRVNAVAPGSIDTPMLQRQVEALPDPESREQRRKDILADIPMARLGTPDEVAACILFLASPEAAYVTGAVLTVDGGYTVR